ncbi:Coiled-coil domain-containing protein 97 [Zalerion maritima]|uniref:Coiled-coil domain-containing protein 97 n=1 Tax=Zalerion maritima TaxID=339359 RepID=A0AAD5WV76_9PEZI|nr:Coiled-coil domain-containing protein 97 [Zalerion maritima]
MTPHHVTSSPRSPGAASFSQPRPRPTKTAEELGRIRQKNRRREWLERNPKYFDNQEHEFADPLLYDALVRRYQSAGERRADAESKGYSRVLEGDLMRGEAKLAKLAENHDAGGGDEDTTMTEDSENEADTGAESYTQKETSEAIELDPPQDRSEARERWREFLCNRFIRGEDEDFDYAPVDKNDQFDVLEKRDMEEEWFDDEKPSWAASDGDEIRERMLDGETGVQDF